MFEILRDPEAAAAVTALPLEYFPVDAAVLYNDLSTPYLAAGLEVELRAGVGPVVSPSIGSAADVDRLRPFDPRVALDYTLDQIRILVDRLDVPVLGFVGAPFTMCSYLVESPRTRDLRGIKRFILEQPDAWNRLAGFWVDHLSEYGIAQHEAGAGAVQIFDSWAGSLSLEDYREFVLPHSMRLLKRLESAGVPTIHFLHGNPELLPAVAEAGGDCISVDWRIPIDVAWERIGLDRAIQGNLDPVALLAGSEVATRKAREILERVAGRPGHIFNLGHGILPDTDHRVLAAVVECVHEFRCEAVAK